MASRALRPASWKVASARAIAARSSRSVAVPMAGVRIFVDIATDKQ